MDSQHDISTQWLTLKSERAQTPQYARPEFRVFQAHPAANQPVRGGIVLVQEIFGVNSHIQNMAKRFAAEGFVTWAPAYFDHIEVGVDLTYDVKSIAIGRKFVEQLGWEQAIEDTKLTAQALRKSLPESAKKVAVIGYCWGGTIAWLSATRLSDHVDASVSYYGRAAFDFKDEKPKIPLLMHFGRHDHTIPLENVEAIAKAHPDLPIHIYDAGHGFNCDARADFNEAAMNEAKTRTLNFLKKNGF